MSFLTRSSSCLARLRLLARAPVGYAYETMNSVRVAPTIILGLARSSSRSSPINDDKISNAEWEKRLTPEQFCVCREGGTEEPFSGIYCKNTDPGTYHCVCCDAELFKSEHKYDSRSGWPSFFDISADNILTRSDNISGALEVICKKCDSHLGHVFDDGPEPTGQRYCINSVAIKLKPASSES